MKVKIYKEKLRYLKIKAQERGLKVRQDKRLTKTPWAAMHPLAGGVLKQPFIKKSVTFDPDLPRRKIIMNINHELFEHDKMKIGWSYKKAHKFANRKQRTLI